MRLPRSRSKKKTPRAERRRGRPSSRTALGIGLAGLLVLGLAAGCAGGPGPTETVAAGPDLPYLTPEERPYLVNPLEGYPRVVDAESTARLGEAHRALLERSDAAAARRAAQDVLATDPELPPAQVLAAQADFVTGDFRAALQRTEPHLVETPGYVAATLLAGRAAEKLGEVPEAFATFRTVADVNALAAERTAELEPRALEIVASRAQDSLGRGRIDEARQRLDRLTAWAPDDPTTLRVTADVARALGDREAELTAVRRLTPDDAAEAGSVPRELLERRADLELDAGDASAGLALAERLAARFPDDEDLEDLLAYAKFRFRLDVLPPKVQETAAKPQLERGDLAVLLYWIFPNVRYAQTRRPRIATDILDDRRREEIARVINLGLMEVDETVHRFSPTRSLTRAELFRSLLVLMAGSEPPVECVRDLTSRPSRDLVCLTAARCGLIPGPNDCLAGGEVSGRQALGFVRQALDRTGGR